MKKVLVPTDFSHTAQQALRYAQRWCENIPEASIHVLHLYMPAMDAEYPNMVPPVPEYIKARQDMLDRFMTETSTACSGELSHLTPMTHDLAIGFPADEIAKQSSEFDLVIMGTTGETDLLDRVFGSVSSNVARRAQCPVLLVPKGVEYNPVKHILYAANYESVDDDALEQLLGLNATLQANVHFLHVNKDGEETGYEKTKAELFENLFEEGVPEFAFTMEEVEGKDLAETLNNYAIQKHIDLVVMATPQRSFWERFLHKSQSRRMALTTKIPLLIYHFDD